MDPNLKTIIHANRIAIHHRSIGKACLQAEDYLVYVLGFNEKAIKKEMSTFVTQVKTMRKRSYAKKESKTY